MSKELSYERAAMRGDPMPEDLGYPDQIMFQALAALYARYRSGTVTRGQAAAEKKQLLRGHETFVHRWSLGNHYAEVIRCTETARTAYRKNRTIENADKLLSAIDGV